MMTTPKHICFTCQDFIGSLAMMSSNTKEPYIIGDCLNYVGKNSGERKTCKWYRKADNNTIARREKLLEEAKDKYE